MKKVYYISLIIVAILSGMVAVLEIINLNTYYPWQTIQSIIVILLSLLALFISLRYFRKDEGNINILSYIFWFPQLLNITILEKMNSEQILTKIIKLSGIDFSIGFHFGAQENANSHVLFIKINIIALIGLLMVISNFNFSSNINTNVEDK